MWELRGSLLLSLNCQLFVFKTKQLATLSAAFSAFSPLIRLNEPLCSPTSYLANSCLGGHSHGLVTQNAPWHDPRTARELPLTVGFAYIIRLLHPRPYMPLGPGVCHGLLQPGCYLAGSRPYNRVCSLGGDCAKCRRLKMTGCI